MNGLEDVGHPRGDVERDLDVGGGGLSREADSVVEENLVRSGLRAGNRVEKPCRRGLGSGIVQASGRADQLDSTVKGRRP
jgi:hypothetical protein